MAVTELSSTDDGRISKVVLEEFLVFILYFCVPWMRSAGLDVVAADVDVGMMLKLRI